MRLPASVSTFMVLLVALLGTVLYVDSRDINTDVNTASESRLPNTYPSADAAFLRYPAGWELSPQNDTTFNLVFEGEDNLPYDLIFQVVPNTDPAQDMEAALRAFLPSEDIASAGTFENNTYNGLPASRFLFEQEGELGQDSSFILVELIRLDDTRLLNIQSPTPVPEDDWEAMAEDLSMILGTLNATAAPEITAPVAAEESAVPAGDPAFTVTPAESWEPVETGDPTSLLLLAPDSTDPQAALQLSRVPKQEVILGLQLAPEAVDDLDMILQALLPSITPLEGPSDVTYFGYEGRQVQFEAPRQDGGTLWVDYALLSAGDDHFVLVQASYLSEEALATYREGVAAMLETVQVNVPE